MTFQEDNLTSKHFVPESRLDSTITAPLGSAIQPLLICSVEVSQAGGARLHVHVLSNPARKRNISGLGSWGQI